LDSMRWYDAARFLPCAYTFGRVNSELPARCGLAHTLKPTPGW
jgi:hypothetical protein